MKRRQRSVEFPPHRNFADDSNVVVVAPGSGDALGERPMNGEETGYGVEKEKDRRGLKDSAREGEEVDDSEDGSEDDSGKSSGSSSSEEDEDEDEDGSDDEDSDEESDSESDEEISEDDSEDDSDSDDSSEDDSSDDSDSDSNAEDSEESSEDDDSEEDSDSGVEEDVRDSSKRGERNARKKGKGKTKTKTEDLSVKPKKGSLKGHRSRKSTKRVVKRVTSKAAGKRKRDQNTEGRASSSAKRSRREKVADKQSASGTRGKRSLSFRSPKIKKNDRLKKPPAMRRLTEDEKLPAQDSAATEKTRRDQEYLATFRARLTPEGRERLRDECTLQRLIVSSAVYDSLARNKRGAGVPGRGHSQGVLDNVSLKFTVSQEVYLALFQTYGTSRRLQTRGKGQVPSSFRGECHLFIFVLYPCLIAFVMLDAIVLYVSISFASCVHITYVLCTCHLRNRTPQRLLPFARP